jgi:hypothetical protein
MPPPQTQPAQTLPPRSWKEELERGMNDTVSAIQEEVEDD